jgi:hypothetical protein
MQKDIRDGLKGLDAHEALRLIASCNEVKSTGNYRHD